jgi:two-component system, chemotaxis family, chemotaxis protein CheY
MEGSIKIVVADDSALARDLIIQALNGLNCEFFHADCGNAAIRSINEHKPDLAILDISMPYPDGLTVLRKIREDKEFHNLPVIICSVECGLCERTEAKRLCANGYVVKPYELKKLRDVVMSAIGKSKKKKKNREVPKCTGNNIDRGARS